jgi:hypothetical protein
MGRFAWEEAVKASINIQVVRIRLVISVDWEHETRMDHIAPAPTITQVGYNTVLFMYKKNECCQSINVYVNNNAKEINPIFPLCRLKINHMT